eukprot:COSAG03_NODE_7215_length_947_cov_47.463443_2_plen_112_part_01
MGPHRVREITRVDMVPVIPTVSFCDALRNSETSSRTDSQKFWRFTTACDDETERETEKDRERQRDTERHRETEMEYVPHEQVSLSLSVCVCVCGSGVWGCARACVSPFPSRT